MKKAEKNTGKTTTTENTEITNRQKQFDRLLQATSTARQIKTRMIEEAHSVAVAVYYASLPLNHFLTSYVYKAEGITDFKKFQEWKQAGASIIKGTKAYPIWGQPVGIQKEERAEEKGESYEATIEENKRFPMCYVFSNLQVTTAAERGSVC